MTKAVTNDNCVFIYTPELEKDGYPKSIPFNTRRAGMTRQKLISMGLLLGKNIKEVAPERLERSEAERFHTSEYIDATIVAGNGDLSPEAFLMGLGTPDCPVFKGMYEYLMLAAGGSTTAASLILNDEAKIAFNPSGGFHHANRAKASGFCYINDVVPAILRLTDAGKRVLLLDIDVHHCDAVQDAFYERDDVMVISMHESGKTLFPGTGFENEIGRGQGRGYNVNIPLPAGTYDDIYMKAFEVAVSPIINTFNPDIIVVEIGMDALSSDPLAHLKLTNNVHADILEQIKRFNKPILATGGGGYDVNNTVRGWALAWSVLCGNHTEEIALGMGGVMLENTEWSGGLRDLTITPETENRENIIREVNKIIKVIQSTVFPIQNI